MIILKSYKQNKWDWDLNRENIVPEISVNKPCASIQVSHDYCQYGISDKHFSGDHSKSLVIHRANSIYMTDLWSDTFKVLKSFYLAQWDEI